MKGYSASYKPANDFGTIIRDGESTGTIVEIPGLQISGLIGSGANGIVFSAMDSLEREVAVKVYPPRLDKDCGIEIQEVHEQAISESRKIATLKHNALATVYKYGRLGGEYSSYSWLSDGWPYCVMEYCPGQPLRDVIADLEGDLESRRSVLRQIFDVLTYAEKCGSLHGDLHEGNVLVEKWLPTKNVSVIDFGTSVFAGKEASEARHARLLRRLTFRLLPELRIAFVPTSRLVRRTGLDMLPRLFAALKLYDQINPSSQGPAKLTARSVGVQLAYATDFDLDVLWPGLKQHLHESDIPVVWQTLIEFLTHEHELANLVLSDAEVRSRLRRELEIRNVETQAILFGE